MRNLRMWKLAVFRVIVPAFVSAALTGATIAQIPRQLLVEVGPNQEVKILADDVSYGEVLRALATKLGWEIEIPPLADNLKISYLYVKPAQPQVAFAKLLEGSKLGYAFLGGVTEMRNVKVIVIPSPPRNPMGTPDVTSSSPITDNEGAPLRVPTQPQAVTTTRPDPSLGEGITERPDASSTVPISDAIDDIGVPPGISPSDVGKATTFSISDAASVVGVPPGMSPADVGKAVTFSISDAAKIVGVAPGVEPGDVGKTLTFPLLNGPAKRP